MASGLQGSGCAQIELKKRVHIIVENNLRMGFILSLVNKISLLTIEILKAFGGHHFFRDDFCHPSGCSLSKIIDKSRLAHFIGLLYIPQVIFK